MTYRELHLELSDRYGMENILPGAVRLMVAPGNWVRPTFSVFCARRQQHYFLVRKGSPAARAVQIFNSGGDTNMLGRWADFHFEELTK